MSNFTQDKANANFVLKILYYLTIALFSAFSIALIFRGNGFFMDTFEHIHSSWLVSTGAVPYRDFFQHHHPLLWYLFSPLTQLFYRNVNIIYIARFVAVLGYWCTLFLMYKVVINQTHSKTAGKFAVLFSLSIPLLWQDMENLRPDIFMYVFILLGVLLFFQYLDGKKNRLVWSYLCWVIAFLFLQKAAICGVGFIIANVILCFKKKTVLWQDVIKAAIFPLLILLGLVWIMYTQEMLLPWYEYNLKFSLIIKKYYGHYQSRSEVYPLLALILAIAAVKLYTYSPKRLTILCMFLVSGLSIYDFSPYPQYFFMYTLLGLLLLVKTITQNFYHRSLVMLSVTVLLLVNSGMNLIGYCSGSAYQKFRNNFYQAEYIIKNTSPEDKVLNDMYAYNLFNPDMGYYWFGFVTASILADLYLGKTVNYNRYLYQKPKIVLTDENFYDVLAYSNFSWQINRNTALLQKASRGDKDALHKIVTPYMDYWDVDMDFIEKNYKKTKTFGDTTIWQR
jgi:hypothetical protein